LLLTFVFPGLLPIKRMPFSSFRCYHHVSTGSPPLTVPLLAVPVKDPDRCFLFPFLALDNRSRGKSLSHAVFEPASPSKYRASSYLRRASLFCPACFPSNCAYIRRDYYPITVSSLLFGFRFYGFSPLHIDDRRSGPSISLSSPPFFSSPRFFFR